MNIVTNNINEICLNEVYNKITENNYKNELSLMFKSFQVSDQVTISLNTDNTLPTNVYGKAYQQANSETYNIDLNTAVLKRCSQEFIASIYFHEAIHVYLKEHQDTWNTQTSSEHLEMLREYFDKLTKSVREIFPSLPEMDAYCIILDCIQNSDKDSDFSQAIFDVIKASYLYIMQSKYPVLASESEIQAIADLYREDGLLGTRNSNCN